MYTQGVINPFGKCGSYGILYFIKHYRGKRAPIYDIFLRIEISIPSYSFLVTFLFSFYNKYIIGISFITYKYFRDYCNV